MFVILVKIVLCWKSTSEGLKIVIARSHMLQQIWLIENMRVLSSTSRRSKRSWDTKNTARSTMSGTCLNRNWEDEKSEARKAEGPSTRSTNVAIVYARLKTLCKGWLSSLSHPSDILGILRSFLCPQWKRRGDLFYTPFERLLTDGAEQALSMPFASMRQTI